MNEENKELIRLIETVVAYQIKDLRQFYLTLGNTLASNVCSLRDQFAMSALAGLLAYSHVNESLGNYHENCTPQGACASAYQYADAMLEARKYKLDDNS